MREVACLVKNRMYFLGKKKSTEWHRGVGIHSCLMNMETGVENFCMGQVSLSLSKPLVT